MDALLENYGWILVLIIFVAPLVTLWWVLRRVRSWWRARAQAQVQLGGSPEASIQTQTESEEPRGGGYSFPFGVPIVVYPLLLVAIVRGAGSWWGPAVHGVYFVLLAAFLWIALSRAQFEKIRASDPSLTRATWLLNWLLFFVLLPLAAWLIFGLSALRG